MKIPYGFGFKDVEEKEIRAAQGALLTGSMTSEQIKLIDAIVSWFAVRLPNPRISPTEK
jgi:hypothetical protein